MGRKVRITKEMILEAAYELLDESGIGAVAIKAIASRLECSTQPVSWHFGSMQELKKELFHYAGMKLYGSLPDEMKGRNAVDAFFVSGVRYITNACDHPNVFRFVNVDDPMVTIGEAVNGEQSIFAYKFDDDAVRMLAEEYKVSPELIAEAVKDTVIYTHGLAVMMIYDNFRLPKEEACRMIYNMGMKMLQLIGIEPQGPSPWFSCQGQAFKIQFKL